MTTTFPFPPQPVTARRQLRLAAVFALKNAELGATVDSPGDWPYPQQNLPAVCVRTGSDSKSALTKKGVAFTTALELEVRAAVSGTTAEAAQDAIEQLWYQIEQAILLDFYVLQLVQTVSSIESTIEIKADGQVHLAGIIGRFRLETFETFDVSVPTGTVAAPSVAVPIVPLTTVSVDVTQQGSDPPFSAQAGDLGLTLTLPGE